MADNTARVRQWRQTQKELGLVPLTIWLSAETKLRLEDMALQSRRTVSELAQEALAAYRVSETVTATISDTALIRELIREELAQIIPTIAAPVTDIITVTERQQPVTDIITVTEQQLDYDPAKFYLGKLCPRQHDYQGTGKSLLRLHNQSCRECGNEQRREKRQQAKRT
jgi:predicted transcriptional regulator